MSSTAETFVPLEDVDDRTVEDFVVLLSELSSSFAAKDSEAQHNDAHDNLVSALLSPDAFVMVHRDETQRIVATATGNVVLKREGWVDDVVALSSQRGKGLGRLSMDALHNGFRRCGISVIRLTSSVERDVAGNLYAKLGYNEGGSVFRAPLDTKLIPSKDEYASKATFEPVNCFIPTGDKAWVYGPGEDDASGDQLASGLKAANYLLWVAGVESANYFSTDTHMSPDLTAALKDTGFKQRNTRLYTLNLEN